MANDLPLEERQRLLGTGFVHIAENEADSAHRFTGYWVSEFEGRPFFVEQGPEWDNPDEAVAWGRERAPKVLVRLGIGRGNVRFFTAGDIPIEGDVDEPVYAWPPAAES